MKLRQAENRLFIFNSQSDITVSDAFMNIKNGYDKIDSELDKKKNEVRHTLIGSKSNSLLSSSLNDNQNIVCYSVFSFGLEFIEKIINNNPKYVSNMDLFKSYINIFPDGSHVDVMTDSWHIISKETAIDYATARDYIQTEFGNLEIEIEKNQSNITR